MKENQNTATEQAKKKHTVAKYVIILIVCMLVGALVGGLMSMASDNFGSVYAALERWLMQSISYLQIGWLALSAVISVLLYFAARTAVFAFERGGNENETISTHAETLLSLGMMTCQLCMIIGYGLFGVATALPSHKATEMLIGVAVVLIIVIFISAYQTVAVKLLKRLSPEKCGHPLSMRFEKDWFKSCDEAERISIYQAAYASYKATSLTLAAVWLVTVILGMFGELGVYPVVVITVVWLVHTLSYLIHALKHGNKKLER